MASTLARIFVIFLTLNNLVSCSEIAQPAPSISAKVEETPFYGMEFVPTEDLEIVKSLGIAVIGQTFAHDGTTTSWREQLDQAGQQKMKVIAWLWPAGWSWNGRSWILDAQAVSFIQSVANHPALFAIYVMNEPYWQNCPGCGYTTRQQQDLYQKIKAVEDVPLFSAVDSIDYWSHKSRATVFADGVCDYCVTWYYPFTTEGYQRDELVRQMKADLETAHRLAPNSKIVWYMQAFAAKAQGLRMPDAAEMQDLASLAIDAGFNGMMWYTWTFNTLYDDTLSRHPELQTTVHDISLILKGNGYEIENFPDHR